MSSSKHRNPNVSFEKSTSFHFPEGLEEYRATVKLEASGLINTWFDDFRVAYTLIQAVQVATGLSYSLIHLAKRKRAVITPFLRDFRLCGDYASVAGHDAAQAL